MFNICCILLLHSMQTEEYNYIHEWIFISLRHYFEHQTLLKTALILLCFDYNDIWWIWLIFNLFFFVEAKLNYVLIVFTDSIDKLFHLFIPNDCYRGFGRAKPSKPTKREQEQEQEQFVLFLSVWFLRQTNQVIYLVV